MARGADGSHGTGPGTLAQKRGDGSHRSLAADRPRASNCQTWVIDLGVAAPIADEAEETVAFLTLGPAAQDTCTIIRDPRTANVFAAWIDETRRKEWVAAAPPDHCEGSASVRECTLRRRFRVDGLSGETVLAPQSRSGRVHGLASRGRPWGQKTDMNAGVCEHQ